MSSIITSRVSFPLSSSCFALASRDCVKFVRNRKIWPFFPLKSLACAGVGSDRRLLLRSQFFSKTWIYRRLLQLECRSKLCRKRPGDLGNLKSENLFLGIHILK